MHLYLLYLLNNGNILAIIVLLITKESKGSLAKIEVMLCQSKNFLD